MKVIIVVFSILLVIANVAKGQEATGLISTMKIGGKTVFVKNDKLIEKEQVLILMKNNPKALSAMKSSNISKLMGHFFLGATVFSALGYLTRPVYNINYDHAKTIKTKRMLGAGVSVFGALTLVSYIVYGKNQKNAIRLYNSGINQNGTRGVKVDMGMSTDGFGLKLRF